MKTQIKNALEMVKMVVVLTLMAYLAIVLMVGMVDPGCGPDGDSQRACIEEINADLLRLVSGIAK